MAGENLPKLTALMARLRAPDGCPWDREQDYDSVKALLLEEAYEVIDTVNARDFAALEDELGDLLFQVVFYSQLAAEEKRFTIDGVIEHVHAKLVRRHPHVFGDIHASTAEEALKSWLSVKEKEREAAAAEGKIVPKEKSLLDGITETLPSTLEAYELGVRVAEVGFDWEKVEDLLDKIEEEVRELRAELPVRAGNDVRKVEEEVGDLLFSAANLARFLRTDPESCLRRANKKFERRFRHLEREVAKLGKPVRECSAKELNEVWERVKSSENMSSPDTTR